MLKGFKDFMLRGNVVELAVAVVIGTAFTELVKSFGDAFILPLVNVAMGGGVTGGTVELDEKNRLLFGTFANGVIKFVITAAVVYFIFVVPVRKLIERQKREDPTAATPPAPAEDVMLLREIRDLLAADNPKQL